jgi:lysophospholipid acyltransferase (LPLAT)-like uncharacterized protein
MSKKFLKRVTASDSFQGVLSLVISLYLKLVFYTSRWAWVGFEKIDSYVAKEAVIVCFWHGRMALIPFMHRWPHKRVVALISAHRDGMVVARTFKRLKIDYTNGATNRGGTRALVDLIRVLKNKDIVGIIPDGPRGPARQLAPGIIHLSRHAQAPILPLAFATSRYITFNSWDKFRLPLPFSRGVFLYGDLIYPLDTTDAGLLETWRLNVENAISQLQDQADLLVKK